MQEMLLEDFDSVFESLVTIESRPELPADSPERRERPRPTHEILEDKERAIKIGMALFFRGDFRRSAEILSQVDDQNDPRVQGYLLASRAMTAGRTREALDACVEAIRRAFYIADLYALLGLLLQRAGCKAKAHAALKRGLRLDVKHARILTMMSDMGIRRPPVVRFLKRSHPLNRALGQVRAMVLPS